MSHRFCCCWDCYDGGDLNYREDTGYASDTDPNWQSMYDAAWDDIPNDISLPLSMDNYLDCGLDARGVQQAQDQYEVLFGWKAVRFEYDTTITPTEVRMTIGWVAVGAEWAEIDVEIRVKATPFDTDVDVARTEGTIIATLDSSSAIHKFQVDPGDLNIGGTTYFLITPKLTKPAYPPPTGWNTTGIDDWRGMGIHLTNLGLCYKPE